MPKFGDVILAQVQFVDALEVKTRPALVLFEEYGNVIVAGITSNTEMKGIPLSRNEGAVQDSIIKLNYIFTISTDVIKKTLFVISKEKKRDIVHYITERLAI